MQAILDRSTTKPKHQLQPEQWVTQHFDYLVNYAKTRIPDSEQPADIVQQTLLAAWKGRESFKGTSSERTWLTTILRNKISDFYRTRSRRITLVDFPQNPDAPGEVLDLAETELHEDRSAEPDSIARRSEVLREVIDAINELPSAAEEIFRLRFLEDQSIREISQSLGISPGSISTRLTRARQRLRNEYPLYADAMKECS